MSRSDLVDEYDDYNSKSVGRKKKTKKNKKSRNKNGLNRAIGDIPGDQELEHVLSKDYDQEQHIMNKINAAQK